MGHLIVKYRKPIIIIYVILLIPAALGYLLTDVNYDMISYMPEKQNSRLGEDILEEKFSLSALGLMMARDKKTYEIEELIVDLESIAGVEEVVWLGDYTDIYMPPEFGVPELQERFRTEDTVLMQIRFTDNARSPQTTKAVNEIVELSSLDENLYFGGEPAILAEMQSAVDDEMLVYTVLAAVIILIVLALSTSLYLDPILFLVSVGIAIVINMGSNYFLGQISFLTASIAAVMQLGVSLDYAIFLMHQLEEEKERYESIEEAMAAAVNKTAVAIASSALTTIGGFCALMVMQNGIGSDMGFVLAKGIVLSLLVTLTLLPGIIIAVYPFNSRYKHKILLPSFKKIAPFLIKHYRTFLIIFLILAVPAYLGQKKVDFYYSNENYLPLDAAAVNDTNAIMDEYGAVDILYVITADEGRQKEYTLVQTLEEIKEVDSVLAITSQVDQALPDLIIPEEATEEFIAAGYRNMMVFLAPGLNEEDSFAAVDLVRREAASLFEEYYVTGPTAVTRDMASLSGTDANNVAIISVLAIGLIVAISFKSLALPVILVLAVQIAIWINISVLYYQGQVVSSLTPIIIGAIQLGATVDYAILYTLRYKDNLALLGARLAAAIKTLEDTGRSILTSALILFSATFSISIVAGIKTTKEMTMLIGRGALTSMFVMYTLLPALLIVFHDSIAKSTAGWPALKKRNVTGKESGGLKK